MNEQDKRKIEDKRVVTDCNDLVEAKVSQVLKPFVVTMAEEHDQTRKAFKDLEDIVMKRWLDTNDVIQYAAIAILFFMMLILPTCN